MVKTEILRVKHQGKIVPTEAIGTILVAEDEEFVQLFLKAILARAGYRLIVAKDGEEALRKFKKHQDKISLVISDIVMPKMNGRVLYEEIYKIKPRIKIIFMSGYLPDTINFNGMLTDQVRFITKPFSKKALFDEIKSIQGSNC
jgi:two-component system cell cycle sensor histidine kinase/response regulator CckA